MSPARECSRGSGELSATRKCVGGSRRFSVGAVERSGSGDQDGNQRRFEQIIVIALLWNQCSNKSNASRLQIPTVLSRGNRHRQGTDRARDSQHQLAVRTAVRKAELRSHPVRSTGKRAIWPREGRFYRRYRAKGRSFRTGRQGDTLPGRGGHIPLGLQPNCCASCRNRSSSDWAALGLTKWTFGSWPRPTEIWRTCEAE